MSIFAWSRHIGERHGNISNNSDRYVPYIISIASYLTYGILVALFDFDRVQMLVASSYIIGTLIMATINLKWKVSVHTSGVAIVCSLLICIFGVLGLLPLIILPAVLWSRLVLKKHTAYQLIMGIGIGFFVPLVIN